MPMIGLELVEFFKNDNDRAIKWFSRIIHYNRRKCFFTFNDQSFMTTIEEICEQTDQQEKGIFIIYDEFGRFLQTLSEVK